ncbi:MAG: DUF2177 family protein [Woeseiaceae bacterium]|nr:DUF2177 family protein [Woeseiaceae bacterium]
MPLVKAYAATALVFLVVDLAWIGLFLRQIYEDQLGSLMRDTPAGWAAGVFYVAYIVALFHFAVRPALEKARWSVAAGNGAALGAIAYGTYTLTNFAIFAGWSVTLVVSDIAWGALLSGSSAAAGYLAARQQ